MSEENVFPILATIGLNDGANKGFWRIQPRDDEGQWIEMGADVLFRFRTGKGSLVVATEKGIYVGPAGRPGMARVMIPENTESGLKAGVYEVESRNLQQFKAIIPTKTGKGTSAGSRKDKFGRPVKTLADSKLPTVEDLVSKVQNITDEDRRLAKGELSPAERDAEKDGRDKSPIADLPAGFEAENPEKVKELLRESGIEPDDFDPDKKKSADSSGSGKKDPKDMSWDELKEEIETPNPTDLERYNKAIREFYRKGGYSQPRQPQGPDQEDSVVEDAFDKADSGEDVPDLDSLIKAIKSPPKDTNKIQTKKRFPIELEPGMVVRDRGANFVVQDKPKQAGTTKDGRRVTSFSVIEEGKKEVRSVRVDGSEPVDVLVGPDNKTPIKRDVVSPEVSKPATPTTPTKPTTPKPPTSRKARISQLLKKYKDDGKDIAPAAKSREELYNKVIRNEIDPETGELLFVADRKGNPRPLNASNAIEDALFEETPDAKIQPDGAIVVERGKFTDTDGKEYAYEIRVQRTKGNQFLERYTFSDPSTKEVLFDVYSHDSKETFNSLYGERNGLVVTRDLLLGRRVPGKKGLDANGIPNEVSLRSNFGAKRTLANRMKWMLRPTGAGIPRVITPEANRRRFLDGHGIIYNKADTRTGKDGQNSTRGTVARGYVADIYELIASKDVELIKEGFKQAMGRLPDTDEEVTALIKALQEGTREKFAGTPDYASIVQLPRLLAAALLQEDLDIRDDAKVPFVSQDGTTPLVPGSYVQFFNNEDGVSVGRVVRLIAGSGKGGNYKDTVAVKFADKTVANLQTRNMKPLTDEELDLTAVDNDNLLTPYVPQLEGEEMREVRLGIDYRDALARKEDSPDDGPDDNLESGDAGAPYLGSDGTDGGSKPPAGKLVEDLDAGDPVYDTDGTLLGEVLVVELVSRDPDEYDITYESPEGEEFLITLKAGELNGPK
jgi:hypothetical protein